MHDNRLPIAVPDRSAAPSHATSGSRSTRLFLSDSDTDDIDPAKLLLLSLQMRSTQIFSSINNIELNYELLLEWESQINGLVAEIRLLEDKKILLGIYRSILEKAAVQTLDPLLLSTFELISNAGDQ